MENIIQSIQSWLSLFFSKNSLAIFNKSIQPYMSELGKFHFSYLNPVFIAFILITFLVLKKFWGPKKSLKYCLIASVVLFLATELNKRVDFPLGEAVFTSNDLINGAAILLVTIVTFLFTFLKD